MQRVCCVMLANGREVMVRRAIQSFKAQTYPLELRTLLIWNSGPFLNLPPEADQHIFQSLANQEPKRTIGALRNEANEATGAFVPGQADVICHWDSDDWSHPNRITEQLSLLQTSGKECVGYRDMLFCRSRQLTEKDVYGPEGSDLPCDVAFDAWLYVNRDHGYCIGTSLCYRREAWQRRPFPDLPKLGKERGGEGEELEWLREVDSLGLPINQDGWQDCDPNTDEPRMIASIHGGNSQDYSRIERSDSWRRAPEWDAYCQERMKL